MSLTMGNQLSYVDFVSFYIDCIFFGFIASGWPKNSRKISFSGFNKLVECCDVVLSGQSDILCKIC
jgi:hypothetical protein